MKGNYPYAVLHVFKTEGMKEAMKMAFRLSKEKPTVGEARAYVDAVVKTNGQPHLLDLYERGVL